MSHEGYMRLRFRSNLREPRATTIMIEFAMTIGGLGMTATIVLLPLGRSDWTPRQ
jgi:hypothetical protein